MRQWRRTGAIGACVLVPGLCLAFGMPSWGAWFAGACAGIGVWRGAAAPIAALLLGGAAAWAGATGWLYASGAAEDLFYRPHERFAEWNARHGHRAYRPSLDVQVQVRHGDLQPLTRAPIAQPRQVRFRTDSNGFRNLRDYAGEPWVLLGDSFVAGSGSDHSALVSEALARRGWRVHNLGFPGGPADYADYWHAFRQRHPAGRPRLLLFVFEGNDLPERAGRTVASPARRSWRYWRRTLEAPFRETLLARFVRSATGRLLGASRIESGEDVEIFPLARGEVGFYRAYIERTRDAQVPETPRFDAALASLAPDIGAVFFVPTKYRVYQPWVAPEERLNHARWAHLAARCQTLGLACHDLTPELRRGAEASLAEARLVYWRDDTHWNAAGMDLAAEQVALVLAAGGRVGTSG